MSNFTTASFADYFHACHAHTPFEWQNALLERVLTHGWPSVLSLPTAAGKTAVLDIALFALAAQAYRDPAERTAPRRIVFVVDRRVVVDATAARAKHIADQLEAPTPGILHDLREALLRYGGETPLRWAELRGGMARDERWARTPLQPTVLVSTVDQVGSRLLHRGYGLSSAAWPIHAGLLANDTLIVLDEAHLSRPFEDTLAALAKYRAWAEAPLELPFHVVRMSATPGTADDAFPKDTRLVLNDARLVPRLTRPKPATLLPVQRLADFAKRCAEQAIAISGPGSTVAVIVNRVSTACAVREWIARPKGGFEGDSILLTGRCRPLQRDRLLQAYANRIMAGRDRQAHADAPPLIVVATQCVEAGADFDFDALVTECCPLDSLRQRFGRLNRLGMLEAAPAVIVGGPDAVSGKDDPVYGNALGATWKWLSEQPAPVDFAVSTLQTALPADSSALNAPVVPGPLVFPAYCDLWAQTSPVATPSPDPAVFLHGPHRGEPEVQVVWRADLGLAQEGAWLEAVTLSPPLAAEALPLRISTVRAWLANTRPKDEFDADVEGTVLADYVPPAENPRPCLVWRGPDESIAPCRDPVELRPGDTIVVPSSYGGCDGFGWNPASAEPVADVADEARYLSRRPVQLRLHPGLARAWGPTGDVLHSLANLPCEPDEFAATLRQTLEGLVASVPEGTPAWLFHAWQVLASDKRTKPIRREDGAWVAVSSKRWSFEAADFDDAGDTFAASRPVALARHLKDVEAMAERFAVGLGLPAVLRASVASAARHHDLGKADPRFQSLLSGGDRAAALRAERREGGPLAKSSERPRSREGRELALLRSGYPKGARHELLSVRLLESAGLDSGALDADLVLHAIASHHGGCRPFAPCADDSTSVQVRFTLDSQPFAASSATALDELDSGVADRFWRLVRRYGWWGLSYLETIVRLADHRVSEGYDSKEDHP